MTSKMKIDSHKQLAKLVFSGKIILKNDAVNTFKIHKSARPLYIIKAEKSEYLDQAHNLLMSLDCQDFLMHHKTQLAALKRFKKPKMKM